MDVLMTLFALSHKRRGFVTRVKRKTDCLSVLLFTLLFPLEDNVSQTTTDGHGSWGDMSFTKRETPPQQIQGVYRNETRSLREQ